jgi:transposase
MDEPRCPTELSEEAWQATPAAVRQFLALLLAKLAALEARLNQTAQNSSKPPSSDPPSAPPATGKTPRGKPKSKGAQPGHPDQQRELLPVAEVTPCRAAAPDLLPDLSARPSRRCADYRPPTPPASLGDPTI